MAQLTPSEYSEVFEQRLLVFLETEPQSNKYRQVLLTPEEFRAVSKSMGKLIKKEGDFETLQLNESDEIYDLPDLTSIHPEVTYEN